MERSALHAPWLGHETDEESVFFWQNRNVITEKQISPVIIYRLQVQSDWMFLCLPIL